MFMAVDYEISLRRAGPDDAEDIKWALYTAFAWNPERLKYPYEQVIADPQAVRFYRDWGRRGDLGVIATRGEDVVGVVFCRLFTEDDHGDGYVDDDTPEVGIAVAEDERGKGLGTRLLDEFLRLARAEGYKRVSMSVDEGNPSLRLCERLGCRELSRDDANVLFVLDL
jgi:RimJ/RimL family protein N-acetyltransferase